MSVVAPFHVSLNFFNLCHSRICRQTHRARRYGLRGLPDGAPKGSGQNMVRSNVLYIVLAGDSSLSAHLSVNNMPKSLPNWRRIYWINDVRQVELHSKAKPPRQDWFHPLSPKNATLRSKLSLNPSLFRRVDRVRKQMWKLHRALQICTTSSSSCKDNSPSTKQSSPGPTASPEHLRRIYTNARCISGSLKLIVIGSARKR